MDSFSIGLRMAGPGLNVAFSGVGVQPCLFPACQSLLQAFMPMGSGPMMPGFMGPPMFYPPFPGMDGFPMPQPGWGSPFPFTNPFQCFAPVPYQPPGAPAYGGYQPSIPNYGAAYRYPEYAQMQQRAREMGTLDGTPVTPYTSFHEDQFHADALNRLSQRAAGRVMDEARQARPQEFNRLQRNEAQLQELLRSREEQGQFYSPSQINRMRAEGIEGLYQEGQLGQGIGQANREYLELLEAWERSEANQQFKYGAGPLEGLPPRSYSESPFNPRREATAPPQERVTEQKPRPTEQQLKEVRRWEPPAQQKPPAAAAEKRAEVPAQKPAAQQAQTTTQKPPAQKPPAQKPAEKPYDPNKDSNALYKAMHGGLTGLGTDEEALFKALDGKSKDQIDKLKANYKDHYGRDLDKDLQSELSGTDYQRARSLMQGKQSSADATALRQAIEGVGTDEKAVFKTLEGKSAEQRQAIQQEYKRQTGRELSSDIKSDFSGAEKDRADALLAGNKARADAATLQEAMKGIGTDEATIIQTLQGKSAQERAALSKAYKEQYGVDLSTRLKGDLGGAELDQAKALLEGNQAKAAAAQIKTAAAGMGTDEASINQALEGKSAEERQAIAQAYRQQYGKELSVELKGELSGNDLQKSQALLERGKLSEAEQLKFALEGGAPTKRPSKQLFRARAKKMLPAFELTTRGLPGGSSTATWPATCRVESCLTHVRI